MILRRALTLLAALVAIGAAISLGIRLMPVDVATWHVDMTTPGFTPEAHWSAFCPRPGERYAPEMSNPVAVLSALDGIVVATPRTKRLAGSPEDGRMTWITRSQLWGFPDFTTAQVLNDGDGARLCIVGRQGIGGYDWGVNAARVTGWAQTLLGLNEKPGLRAF